MNLKIYTMTHKQFQPPADPIYVPLQVGKAVNQPLGYLGDDTGDNISDLNEFYGELTGLYWVWQNDKESDVVGICHYRRYFLDEAGKLMTQQQYEQLLQEYDVITSDVVAIGDTNNYENFTNVHGTHNLDAVGEVLKRLYPMDYWAYEKVMQENGSCYGNLMVADKQKFDAYCEWLFTIFLEVQPEIDVEGFDLYHRRVFGFISEVLLSVWLTARNYRVYRCQIGITAEKAETQELKQAMTQLIENRDIDQAKELFYSYQKLRPDVKLQASDLSGDIAIIEKLLYIMHEERSAGVTGLLDFSNNLTVLIEHYKLSRQQAAYQILKKDAPKKVDKEQIKQSIFESGKAYFQEMPLSDIALNTIIRELLGELSLYDYFNAGKPSKKVSVIVPVYNGVGQFEGAIGNLVHQTLEEIEIIFIDDCSTDDSYKVLKECERQFPDKVRVLQTPENLRAGGARNLGLDVATGEYIGFVDCDDLPDVAMYEKMYAKAKEKDYDLVDGGFLYDAKDTFVLYTSDEHTGKLTNKKRDELLRLGGYLWSKLVKRSLIEKNGLRFREKVHMLEDADFFDVLLVKAKSIANVKEVVYRYHNTENSLSKEMEYGIYFSSLYEAMKAIYDKLHKDSNYKELQMAIEFEQIQFYCSAVSASMKTKLKREDYPVLENLYKIQKLKKKVVKLDYGQNKYVMDVFKDMDIAMMHMNDQDPKMFLETEGIVNWEFQHITT